MEGSWDHQSWVAERGDEEVRWRRALHVGECIVTEDDSCGSGKTKDDGSDSVTSDAKDLANNTTLLGDGGLGFVEWCRCARDARSRSEMTSA